MALKPTHEDLEQRVRELERKVADRERAMEQLEKVNRSLTQVMESYPHPFMVIDAEDYSIHLANTAAKQEGTEAPKTCYALNHNRNAPCEEKERLCPVREVKRTGKPVRVEHSHFLKDGSSRTWAVRAYPVFDENGHVAQVIHATLEITARKLAEKALAESEHRYRLLTERMSDVIWITDQDLRFTYVSPSIERFTGYTPDDLLGKTVLEHLPLSGAQEAASAFMELIASDASESPDSSKSRTIELQRLHKDGSLVWGEITATILYDEKGNPTGVLGVTREISERKKAERELLEEKETAQKVLDTAGVMFVVIDADQSIALLNRKSCEVLGYRETELLGKNWFDTCLPERIRNSVKEGFTQLMTGSLEPMEYYENPVLTRSGEERIILWHNTVLLDQKGGIKATMSSGEDITERKRAEQALRESEEKYRALFEGAVDGIYTLKVTNKGARVVDCNPQGLKLLGCRRLQEIISKSPLEFSAPTQPDGTPSVKLVEERLTAALAGESPCFEWQCRRLDGTLFDAEVSVNHLTMKTERFVQAILRDITERKRMEKELQETQRIEALGVLAGGIAHDFNNILTAVMTNLSMARMWGDLNEDTSQMLADAEGATLRAKDLSQQLLAFAKGGSPIKRPVSVSKLLKDTIRFILSGSNVRCEYDLADDLWLLDADEAQIGQVIQNLIINADQAMPEGGIIKIRAENVMIEKTHLNTKQGRHVKISIRDRGHGITEKQLPKIFDPFFTTKEKGRGLGLATAFSIVRRHNGFIHVDSELGVGTSFHVHLPASKVSSDTVEKKGKRSLKGSGKILLIDDEEMILRSTAKGLERLGYEVHIANDGEDGIQLYERAKRERQPFDVVIMDLTIAGGMGGKQAIRELRSKDPEVKAIVSSGYSEDPVMSNFQDHGFCGIVTKPYSVDDLAEAIDDVLDRI